MPLWDQVEARRLLRFVVVGGSSTALTLLIFAIAIDLGVWYPLGALVGYAAGFINGYTWNRIWTFEAGAFHLPEFSRYLLVQGSGLAANLLGLLLIVELFDADRMAAEVVTLVPIMLVTYAANRWWTFRPRAR